MSLVVIRKSCKRRGGTGGIEFLLQKMIWSVFFIFILEELEFVFRDDHAEILWRAF